MSASDEFFSEIQRQAQASSASQRFDVTKLGTVLSYSSPKCMVYFDSEATTVAQPYVKFASYSSPVAGDRVLCIRAGSTWVVMGKIG